MSKMSRKKKVKRRRFLASSCPDLVIGARGTEEETKGEEVLQMMRKDIAYHEVHNNKEKTKKEIRMEREAYNETAPHEEGLAASPKEIHIAPHEEGRVASHEEIRVAPREEIHRVPPAGTVREERVRQEDVQQEKVQQEDELKIRGTRIADSLLMQLEDEVIGLINRRLEEHVAKRIKGVLVPVAKLSLKVQRIRKKLTSDVSEKADADVNGVKTDAGEKGDKSNKDKGDKESEADKGSEVATRHLLDLEDDLDYILENSKLKRISPQVGERFNPNLHEEVDFSWNPDREESEILATLRDGFFWEYNQEMIIKPQVVVNRRLSA